MKTLIKILSLVSFCLSIEQLPTKTFISFNPNLSLKCNTAENGYTIEPIQEWYSEEKEYSDFVLLDFDIMYNVPNKFGFFIGLGISSPSKRNLSVYSSGETQASERILKLNKVKIGTTFNDYKKNISYYTALSILKIKDTYKLTNNTEDINVDYSAGISIGILIIPYQLQQLSSLTFQLGYNFNSILGSGIELGIGYRI